MESESEQVPSTSGTSIKKDVTEIEKGRPPPPPCVPKTPEPEIIQKGLEDVDKQVLQERRRSSTVKRESIVPEPPKVISNAKEPESDDSDEEEDEYRDLTGKMITTKGIEVFHCSFGSF